MSLPQQSIPIRRAIDDPDPRALERPRAKLIRVMGVDLGQASDRSAATVLERRTQDGNFIGPAWPYVTLQKIRRYPEGADYMLQADDLLGYPDLDFMVVEYNGVGRPVVDRLRQRARQLNFRGRIIAVVTAASNTRMHEVASDKGKCVSVPKINLVTSINLLQQSGLLRVETKDRETAENLKVLKKEMRSFQIRITRANNLTLGAEGPGQHDDLVMSLGLAAWFMDNRMRQTAIYMP